MSFDFNHIKTNCLLVFSHVRGVDGIDNETLLLNRINHF